MTIRRTPFKYKIKYKATAKNSQRTPRVFKANPCLGSYQVRNLEPEHDS